MKNTGVQSECFRWVNKNRIVSKTGKKVSPTILDQLDRVLLSFAPSHKKEVQQLNNEIESLKTRITDLEAQLSSEKMETAGSD